MDIKKTENLKLNKARQAKDDEYYTLLSDIEQEVCKYKDQLKGKVILMPCDDPELIKSFPDDVLPEEKASQFWVYFHKQFSHFGLKKIMATHYSGDDNDSYLIEYGGGSNDANILDFQKTKLIGNGDFRSHEVQKLYEEADVIITNPPFSLMREFAKNLIEKNKKFLIIGSQLSFTYNDFFPLLKNNFLKTGFTHPKKFLHYDRETKKISVKKFGNVGWFTNLDTLEKKEIQIFRKYKAENYELVDQLKNTINVKKIKDIPHDYEGDMAVPITILDKKYHNILKIKELKRGLSVNGINVFQKVIVEIIK